MIVVADGVISERVWSHEGWRAPGAANRACGPATCLILTGNGDFRDSLRLTIGPMAVRCSAPADLPEAEYLADLDHAFAIVDVRHPLDGDHDGVRKLAERLAGRPATLLVICGDTHDSDSVEIWARQLGAFVYLPGAKDARAVAALIGEVRRTSRG
jgi:hypothetical protein